MWLQGKALITVKIRPNLLLFLVNMLLLYWGIVILACFVYCGVPKKPDAFWGDDVITR